MSYLMSHPDNRIKAALTRVSAPNVQLAPRNHICRAIADRIERAIQWGHPFHAYVVLPVHPEGKLNDLAIVGQIHWTLQSLVYASDSLVNRVRLALYAKQVCKQPRNQREWEAAKRKGLDIATQPGLRVFEADIERHRVNQYLTLLNLRNCQTLAGTARTEQIYVHSKLLIVDDRFVIVGSANINDRSLAGGRDSELAVLLMDLSTQTAPMDGKNHLHVRKFAHKLRVDLWNKHFGLIGHSDLVQPAKPLASLMDKPAHPATWQAIQAIAKNNADAYAKAFKWVPRDGASIWPTWSASNKFRDNATDTRAKIDRKRIQAEVEPFAQQMPFSEEFWELSPVCAAPVGIQGFICALPMEWTAGENNHPDMSMVLLTNNTEGEDDTRLV
jgi:phospholipase D1/2